MELLNILYNLMSLVFVLGTMASMGLSLTMRIYWPEQAILDGKWEPAPIKKASN